MPACWSSSPHEKGETAAAFDTDRLMSANPARQTPVQCRSARCLAPGDAVMFDNWRALHARDAYQGYRRLCGAYLNKEDVESRLRKLRAA